MKGLHLLVWHIMYIQLKRLVGLDELHTELLSEHQEQEEVS